MFSNLSQQISRPAIHFLLLFSLACTVIFAACKGGRSVANTKNNDQAVLQGRERILINDGWKFMRYTGTPDNLKYDVRPEVTDRNDNVVADSKPTESVAVASTETVLRKWILPSANDFIKDPAKHHIRPNGDRALISHLCKPILMTTPGSRLPFRTTGPSKGPFTPKPMP